MAFLSSCLPMLYDQPYIPIYALPQLLQEQIVTKMRLMALLRLRKTCKWGAAAFDRCQTAQLELLRTVAIEATPEISGRPFYLREPYRGEISEYVGLTRSLLQLNSLLQDDDETEEPNGHNLRKGLERMMAVWRELFGKSTRCKILNWFTQCVMKTNCCF